MASTAIHRCHNCGCETDVTSVLGVFEDNPHCRQCGLSVSERDFKMQDELASLLSHNLHLNNTIGEHHQYTSTPTTPQVVPETAPITYISQHYHHSAHQVPSQPRSEVSTSSLLHDAGVDAAALLPSQLQLFKNAPHDQRLRLIELWTLAPPIYGNQMMSNDLANWPQTSLQQEEEAAKSRWAQMEQERSQLPPEPKTNAEPYMANGYSQATDPVYRSREWWRMPALQPIEHQYGMLQHMQLYNQQLDQSGEDMEML